MKNNMLFSILFFTSIFCWACEDEKPRRRVVAESERMEGATIFRKNCVTCHGVDGGLGMNGAANLSVSILSLDERILVVTNGRGTMQAWKSILSEAEIKAVAEYTIGLRKQ